MFPAPPSPEVTLSAHFMLVTGPATYANYSPKNRVQCDECVWVLHEARGVGQPPNAAKVIRTVGSTKIRLCRAHEALWRKIDGK